MTTTHTPPRTRSQTALTTAADASATRTEDPAPTATETNAFEAVYLELQKLREERRQEQQGQRDFRNEMEARLRERDAAVTRLEERLNGATTNQLSLSENISAAGHMREPRASGAGEGVSAERATRGGSSQTSRLLGAGEGACAGRAASTNANAEMRATGADGGACAGRATRDGPFTATRMMDAGVGSFAERAARGLKLKPDTYDGAAPLREFLAQFSLIASANQWTEPEKAVVLASCLRGKARSLLESCADGIESLTFSELKSKLELRFGESELAQSFYLQFTNRKQSPGEDYATLGADLERLSRKAYSECTHEVRDKIACSQFVAALSDGFIKRSLQVEGVTSLRVAIERAKTLKLIDKNSFSARRDDTSRSFRPAQKEASQEAKNGKKWEEKKENKPNSFKNQTKGEAKKTKECWKCGKIGHFRSECPSTRGSEN